MTSCAAGHDELPPSIALVGFMGSGKSTVGRALARHLGWEFVDTDALVEAAAGCDIADLFAGEGEAAFRAREAAAVRAATAAAGSGQVVATGGGVVLRDENVIALRNAGLVVWLTARPDVIAARTAAASRRANKRPLLTHAADGEERLARVLALLGERGPLYQAACHFIVDASERSPRALAAEIQRRAWRWQRERNG